MASMHSTPAEEQAARAVAPLVIANAIVVLALCWWGWSLRDPAQPREIAGFLAVLLPTSVYALVTTLVLNRRYRRLVQGSEEATSS